MARSTTPPKQLKVTWGKNSSYEVTNPSIADYIFMGCMIVISPLSSVGIIAIIRAALVAMGLWH